MQDIEIKREIVTNGKRCKAAKGHNLPGAFGACLL
jgi:hypothetical protein